MLPAFLTLGSPGRWDGASTALENLPGTLPSDSSALPLSFRKFHSLTGKRLGVTSEEQRAAGGLVVVVLHSKHRSVPRWGGRWLFCS